MDANRRRTSYRVSACRGYVNWTLLRAGRLCLHARRLRRRTVLDTVCFTGVLRRRDQLGRSEASHLFGRFHKQFNRAALRRRDLRDTTIYQGNKCAQYCGHVYPVLSFIGKHNCRADHMTRMRCSQEGLSAVKRPGWRPNCREYHSHLWKCRLVLYCVRTTQRQKASEVTHAMQGSVHHRESPCMV